MEHTYLNEKSLINNCPCGYTISTFPLSLNYPNINWDLTMAHRDYADENKYHVEYQGFSNYKLKYKLEFECINSLGKHICNVISLVDVTENINSDQHQ